MVKLTLYTRLDGTYEEDYSDDIADELPSGEVRKWSIIRDDGREVTYLIRPYYRRKIDGVMNIFAEEHVSTWQ